MEQLETGYHVLRNLVLYLNFEQNGNRQEIAWK